MKNHRTRKSCMSKSVMRALVCSVAMVGMSPAIAEGDKIEFWTQTYGDQLNWKAEIKKLIEDFEAESGIAVQHEIVPWGAAFQTWLSVAQGGAHPDCADMYWLHSFSAIGGDKFGPMPLNEYRDRFPTLEQDFYAGALKDAIWQEDFYGIPWRGDIRAMIYRTDAAKDAGLSGPPTTWDEIIEAAKAMTTRDDNGNVTRWGFAFGSSSNTVSWLLPYYWQAGGLMMTEDGKTATIDNEAMRAALTFMRDMVWTHKVVNPDSMEKGYEQLPLFVNGSLALIGSAEQSWGVRLDREFPEIEGTWAMAPSAMGPKGRDSFSGAGYVGVLRGAENVEGCIAWMEFLSRDENMQRLTEASGTVSTKPAVMASEFWSDRPWKVVVGQALNDAHTSQHPAPAWSAIATPAPGGILYDLMYDAIILQKDMDEAIARAQERMQAELDR